MSTTREETENSRRAITDRARKFGKTVRELEDKGLDDRRRRTRTEWRRWYKHLSKFDQRLAIDAYYDEFCREPLDNEY